MKRDGRPEADDADDIDRILARSPWHRRRRWTLDSAFVAAATAFALAMALGVIFAPEWLARLVGAM